MDITKTIAELKSRPDFAEKTGMILVHNGTVRGSSRQDGREVTALEVQADTEKIEQLRRHFLAYDGIYEILIEAHSGSFFPGDDLLYIVVAGDIRENVKMVLSELLERIKSEAVTKKEIFA